MKREQSFRRPFTTIGSFVTLRNQGMVYRRREPGTEIKQGQICQTFSQVMSLSSFAMRAPAVPRTFTSSAMLLGSW